MTTKWFRVVLVCVCLLSMVGNAPAPGFAQGPDMQVEAGPKSVGDNGFTW
jgi:hypothetical protein